MLQHEQIKGLDDTKPFNHFKKSIFQTKEVQELDFFKTNSLSLKNKIKKRVETFTFMLFLIMSFFTIFLITEEFENHKVTMVKLHKEYNLYTEMTDSLKNKNTLDVEIFKSLKNLPTNNADYLASGIINQILLNNKVPLDIKNEVFKYYIENWNSGTIQEKKSFDNCAFDLICHKNENIFNKWSEKTMPLLEKAKIFSQHPDIFEKYNKFQNLKQKSNVVDYD